VNEKGGYIVRGKYRVIGEGLIEIYELPIKKWTRDFKN
jgi:hypothetical protein